MPPATHSATSFRVGKYRIVNRIGRGGMGVVYRAFDLMLEREVALKILALEANLDTESRRRFEVEAKAAAKLQHPNIVTVYELGEESNIPYIAMELLSGTDVDALLRLDDSLLVEEAFDIMVQVCRGLAYAHERRIVHRDVKPSNVRLLDDGVVKLLDFGIAKLGELTLTQSGMVLGTVHYMSPEQIRGQPLDGRSDIFSAGVILYELCTKKRPFSGRTATEILDRILYAAVPPLPPDLCARVPRLSSILDKALAKEADGRYPSAAAFADDMAALLAGARKRDELRDDTEARAIVNRAGRMIRAGHLEETINDLTNLLARNPRILEARRALRAAVRENEQRQSPTCVAPESDFPELASTFGQMVIDESGETETIAPTHRRNVIGRDFLILGGVLLMAAVVATMLLLREAGQSPTSRARPQPSTARPTIVAPGADFPASVATPFVKRPYSRAVRVVTNPPGATLVLNGSPVPGVTPLIVDLRSDRSNSLELLLEGHLPETLWLTAAQPLPVELRCELRPAGPITPVVIASTYPLDVVWKGHTLVRRVTSPRIELPRGRHELTVLSEEYFLRRDLTVMVGADPVRLSIPSLGRLSVRAYPDNCDVFIDGVFADNPPILNRPISSGAHVVEFRWPGGAQRREIIEAAADGVTYVFGQKEAAP